MIRIYGKDNCIYCKKAKELLDDLNRQYEYLKIPEDVSKEQLLELVGSRVEKLTVPQIFNNDTWIGGYSDLLEYIENTSGGYGEGAL